MTNFLRKYTATIVAAIVITASVVMPTPVCAQTDSLYIPDTTQTTYNDDTICLISNIEITGNKKTKQKTILCELEFEKGDTVSASRLPQLIEKSQTNLKKTSIFNYVTITYASDDDTLHTGYNFVTVNINVEECWYTWPMFDISPHNGNLNEWFAHTDLDLID
jgi:hypothetical protein